MSIERVAVTGGNGKIGTAIIEAFAEGGYHTIDVARGKRREEVSDEYRTTDLLDAGEVYGAFAASDPDAVVHMGTIPSPTSYAGHTTFESNAMSAYNVLEAATALDTEAIVLPSSINVMGADFQEAKTDVRYLPVDEDHPLTPRDPYALGKYTTEGLGEGFARRRPPGVRRSSRPGDTAARRSAACPAGGRTPRPGSRSCTCPARTGPAV